MECIGRHLVELQTPAQNSRDVERDFQKFQDRYLMFAATGCVISITDNSLGRLSFTAPEVLEALGVPVDPESLELHLNTFHRKSSFVFEPGKEQNEQDLDILLQHAMFLGARYLLCVSGDGSERLPRLKPEDLGNDPAVLQAVTSVELLKYVEARYPWRFTMGVAYNQYEPLDHEISKLRRKIAAGARFLATQPVIMKTDSDRRLELAKESLSEMMAVAHASAVQVILEGWMSKKLSHLLPKCVGYDIDFGDFNPEPNLAAMRECHPECNCYLTMVFGKKTLDRALSIIG